MLAATHKTLTATLLKSLFEANYTRLVRTSFRLLQNQPDAEDVVQEVFCTLWRRKDELQVESYEGYLLRAVYNASLTQVKKGKLKVLNPLEETNVPYQHTHATADHSLIFKETSVKVDRAINSLPPACRTIFILSRFENKSNKQIATDLDLALKTVENQMTKALRLLREALLGATIFLLLKNIF